MNQDSERRERRRKRASRKREEEKNELLIGSMARRVPFPMSFNISSSWMNQMFTGRNIHVWGLSERRWLAQVIVERVSPERRIGERGRMNEDSERTPVVLGYSFIPHFHENTGYKTRFFSS